MESRGEVSIAGVLTAVEVSSERAGDVDDFGGIPGRGRASGSSGAVLRMRRNDALILFRQHLQPCDRNIQRLANEAYT